jgi:hypothetical protein
MVAAGQVGWHVSDMSETWTPLKHVKESHPVKTAEFAKARSVADEPAFACWVPHMLRKRDITLSKINAWIRKTTHKHGIEMPTSVDNANKIDRCNGNAFWKDAFAKEMTKAGAAFGALKESIKAPPIGWSKVTPSLGCEHGLHLEGQVGPRRTQNPKPNWIDFYVGVER